MLRMRIMAPVAMIMLLPALAAGRPAAETCVNAGYRVGTVAFDMCVTRVDGDDPLAALEGGELSSHADKDERKAVEPDALATIAPARTVVPTAVAVPNAMQEELPASFNTPTGLIPPSPPPAAPVSQGPTWPTPPTAPTLPVITAPNWPGWNFGSQ